MDAAVLELTAATILRDSEQRSKELLSALPVAVYTTDAAGRITYYNEAAAALWGHRPALGKNEWCGSWRLHWPDGKPMPHDECPMAVALTENRAIKGAEAIAERPDGTRVSFLAFPTPLHDGSGILIGAINTLVDITERKQAEEALRQSEEFKQRIIASSSDCIKILDLNGRLLWMSEGGQRALEVDDLEPFIGSIWSDFFDTADRSAANQAVRTAARGNTSRFAGWAPTLKGTTKYWESILTTILGPGGAPEKLLAVSRDMSDRKRTEQALHESRETLVAALAASQTGAFRWDPHSGAFLGLDDNFKRLFGFGQKETVRDAQDVISRLHPEDVPSVMAAVEACAKGADFDGEFRVILPNGDIRWLFDRARGVFDEAGNLTHVVGACTDVTRRKQAEEAAHASAQRFQFMAESMPQKMFTAEANGKVDYFNPQWMEFTGLSFEQIRDWGWTQFIHPDDVEENIRAWQHSIDTGEPFEFVHRFRRADGEYRWHLSRAHAMRDADGNISMWTGSNTEIHEQKEMAERLQQKEQALGESEAHLRLVLDSAADGFYGVDCEGVTTLCNAAFVRMLGFARPEDAVGRKLHDVIHHSHADGSHYPKEKCPIYQAAQTGQPAHVDNELFFRCDGTSFPVEYWVQPILRDGKLEGAVCNFIDISERKVAQEQQKLLLREMSHRVKNLFAVTSGLVTMSARTASTPGDMAKSVRDRLGALAIAHDLVRPDLDNTKEEKRHTTLSGLLHAILAPYDDLEPAASPARILLRGPEVQIGETAATSIALALHELATNAAKYGALSSAKGSIKIDWSVQNGELLLKWAEQNGPSLAGPPQHEGFGSQLARRSIEGQLRGQVSRDWNSDGLVIRLSASMNQLAK